MVDDNAWITPVSATRRATGAGPARPPHVTRQHWEREAARLLPRLARTPNARLIPLSDSSRFAVTTTPARAPRARHKVAAPVVAAWAAEGLVTGTVDGAYALSETGHAWLRRRQAAADPFRGQHQIDGTRMIDGRGHGTATDLAPMRVNLAETPLGWLRRRKGSHGRPLISQAQFDAGEKLRADFTLAQMTPRLTASLDAQHGGSRSARGSGPAGIEITDRAMAARQRFYRALDAVGPGLSEPLVDVCCYLDGLEDAERRMGWPQRAGKVVLAIALERLADHYGLLGSAGPASRRRHLWRADDANGTEEADPADEAAAPGRT